MGDKDYRVEVRTGEGLYTEISAGGHTLVADEPKKLGGTGAGPDPYDYLAGALGACAAMTLRMYADRKGWPLESVTVRLEHGKIHAKDCESCETENGKVDRIEIEIDLEGDLEEAQRAKLLEIAGKCPVHKTLTSEILIEAVPAGAKT